MGDESILELEYLLDTCPYLTWIKDNEGNISYINQIYAEVIGESKKSIIGKKEEDIWGVPLKEGYNYIINKGIHLEVNEMALYDEEAVVGVRGIAREITSDKEMELLQRELEIFLSSSRQMVCRKNKEGKIELIGEGFKTILGWDQQDIDELIRYDRETADYIREIEQHYSSKMGRQGHYVFTNKIECKDGTCKDICWTIKYIEHQDSIIAIGHDVTEMRQEEEEYLMLQVEMELEYIKGELLAYTSNEFKTPINTILYAIELLKERLDKQEITTNSETNLYKYIGLIKQNAYRLIRLINNMVDSNSIEAGEYNLNLGNHDIIEIITEIITSVEKYIENKGIKLEFYTAKEKLVIACDPDKIERIILNCISNAIKYSSAGGTIQLKIECSRRNLYIHILDNGEGISKSKLKGIFERFVQAEDGLTRKREGSGIGLSIVKSLVEMHGGKVKVRSQLGEGTEFIIMLPRKKQSRELNDAEKARQYKKNNRTEVWNIEFADIYE